MDEILELIAELRSLTPAREYIIGPLLGLRPTEVAIRYFAMTASGDRPSEPYWVETVDFATPAGLAWLRDELVRVRAARGALLMAPKASRA